MILVDTNVWSELMRPAPDERVSAWDRTHAGQTWLATVVVGELLSGVAAMPEGKRKAQLLQGYEAVIAAHADRVVPFDLDASRHYAAVVTEQTRWGRNPGTADAQIAAIALARRMTLATRNAKHFEGLGIPLVNPWHS